MIARGLPRVLVLGGGELGSAVSHRLARSGMEVFVADLDAPTCIRTEVCFAMALRAGAIEVEGVTAVKAATVDEAFGIAAGGRIPVLALRLEQGAYRMLARELRADVLIDARMLKRKEDMSRDVAPLVIALGPGFTAPEDVHAVIETNRGHGLGRAIYDGCAEADTGIPGEICGYSGERLIRSPASGVFTAGAKVGDLVAGGQVVGVVVAAAARKAAGEVRAGEAAVGARAGERTDVVASLEGLLRGLISDGVNVEKGQKIGDVDPRGSKIDPRTISDKGRAVAGGVLEAIMHWWSRTHA